MVLRLLPAPGQIGRTYDYDKSATPGTEGRLSELISRSAPSTSDRYLHGHPSAVLPSYDLQRLEETIAALADPDLIAQVLSPDADVADGRVESAAA